MSEPDNATTGSAELHHRELALFLSLHRDRAPGILWADHEHPAGRPRADSADLALLSDGLARLVGRPARTARDTDSADRTRSDPSALHTLVHQTEGGGDWAVSPGPAQTASPPLHCRLRAGEVLYIPPRWAWQVELSDTSSYIVTFIEP